MAPIQLESEAISLNERPRCSLCGASRNRLRWIKCRHLFNLFENLEPLIYVRRSHSQSDLARNALPKWESSLRRPRPPYLDRAGLVRDSEPRRINRQILGNRMGREGLSDLWLSFPNPILSVILWNKKKRHTKAGLNLYASSLLTDWISGERWVKENEMPE